MMSRTTLVAGDQGIHALIAHQLCRAAGEFSASIWIMSGGQRCSLTKPIELLAMGIGPGAEVTVLADGIDASEALDTVCDLLRAAG